MVGLMRNRITLKTLGYTTDAGGGTSSSVVSSYSVWAEIQDRNGGSQFSQGQIQDDYDYKITIRYYPSKVVTTNTVLEYRGKDLAINSVTNQSEGKNRFLILRCKYHGG